MPQHKIKSYIVNYDVGVIRVYIEFEGRETPDCTSLILRYIDGVKGE